MTSIFDVVNNTVANLLQSMKLQWKKIVIIISIILAAALFTTVIGLRRTITLDIDGEKKVVVTYSRTLGKVLEHEKIAIDLKDRVSRSLDSRLARADTVSIKKAVDVTVNVDGEERNLRSSEESISEMLSAEGIQVGSEDKVSPDLNEVLVAGMAINIIRVETKYFDEKVAVEFPTVEHSDPNLLTTYTKVLQDGENGEKQLTYKVTYENGKEAAKEIIKEALLKEPISQVLIKGALQVFTTSRGDGTPNYSRELTVKSTAYYAVNGIGRTYTASGRLAVRNPMGFSTIAVDPNVIPMGSKLYVEGYGYAIAADKGDDIKGNFIDVYFDTRAEANQWAVKYVKVYLLP